MRVLNLVLTVLLQSVRALGRSRSLGGGVRLPRVPRGTEPEPGGATEEHGEDRET